VDHSSPLPWTKRLNRKISLNQLSLVEPDPNGEDRRGLPPPRMGGHWKRGPAGEDGRGETDTALDSLTPRVGGHDGLMAENSVLAECT